MTLREGLLLLLKRLKRKRSAWRAASGRKSWRWGAPFRKRFALVVGNSDYRWANVLPNARNDAWAIGQSLRKLGFKVTVSLDVTRTKLDEALEAFRAAAAGADEILFYYCGHGLQVFGKNYLVPVDGNLVRRADLQRLVRFQEDVLQPLSELGNVKLFFLDACRNDPFEVSHARASARARDLSADVSDPEEVVPTGRGLFPEQAGFETLIGFAAEPGDVAFDGLHAASEHSPYTEAMLKHLPTRGLEVEQLMARVSKTVRDESRKVHPDNPQVPWISTNLGERVHFNPPSWEPVYVLALLGALAGLVTAPLVFDGTCYVGASFIGVLFGAVPAYGVLRWGRGTWWAAGMAATVTMLAWYAAGYGLEWAVLKHRGIGCNFGGSEGDIALAAGIAGLAALMGTLASLAISSKAFRSVTAWSTTTVVATVVLIGIYIVIDALPSPSWFDMPARFMAVTVWYAALGASIGYAFAVHVPGGPESE